MFQKKNYQSKSQQNPPSNRLGQTTVGLNRDERIEQRGDDLFAIMEVQYAQTDVGMKPSYNDIWRGNREGLENLTTLLNQVLDGLDGTIPLPVETSVYDVRFKGEEHGR